MKKLLILFLILFCLPISIFAWTDTVGSTLTTTTGDYAVEDIWNGVYDPTSGTLKVMSAGATFYLTATQLELLRFPTSYIINFPTDYPDATAASTLSNIESNQALLQRPTIYMNYPIPVYEDQTIFISSGTSGMVTSATSQTITVTDKVKRYFFYYFNNGDTSTYCTIKNNRIGGADYLTDGLWVRGKFDYAVATTFTVTDLVAGATFHWKIETDK